LGQIFIKWGDIKQYNGAVKLYTLGPVRKYKKGRFKLLLNTLNLNLKMGFMATFNNISVIPWLSVLLVEETGVSIENHQSLTNFIT
jgi:hypothetical protein